MPDAWESIARKHVPAAAATPRPKAGDACAMPGCRGCYRPHTYGDFVGKRETIALVCDVCRTIGFTFEAPRRGDMS